MGSGPQLLKISQRAASQAVVDFRDSSGYG